MRGTVVLADTGCLKTIDGVSSIPVLLKVGIDHSRWGPKQFRGRSDSRRWIRAAGTEASIQLAATAATSNSVGRATHRRCRNASARREASPSEVAVWAMANSRRGGVSSEAWNQELLRRCLSQGEPVAQESIQKWDPGMSLLQPSARHTFSVTLR
jgi:hypothetical protein